MTIQRNDPVINRKLLSILDNLIQAGHWDKSLFLQATGKEIRDLKDSLSQTLDLTLPDEQAADAKHAMLKNELPALSPDKMEVYVALYQANGAKISNWESALELLLSRSASRPIYDTEAKAKDMMVKKGKSENNAYVVIAINKADVIPMPEKHVTDKYGHELVTVKENALKLENIRRFVHVSGNYAFYKNQLLKQ